MRLTDSSEPCKLAPLARVLLRLLEVVQVSPRLSAPNDRGSALCCSVPLVKCLSGTPFNVRLRSICARRFRLPLPEWRCIRWHRRQEKRPLEQTQKSSLPDDCGRVAGRHEMTNARSIFSRLNYGSKFNRRLLMRGFQRLIVGNVEQATLRIDSTTFFTIYCLKKEKSVLCKSCLCTTCCTFFNFEHENTCGCNTHENAVSIIVNDK
jgi:hypothetical protein